MQELITYIETTYHIKVDEDEMMPENFDSLIAIQNYVNEKLS